jgi:pimeloyl-ACP methyl ester carboxylesterase
MMAHVKLQLAGARAFVGVSAAWAISGCFGAPRPVSPIPALHYASPGNQQATPVLLLPGRRSRADDFERTGFVAAVRELGLSLELVAVDAHLGYYVDNQYRLLPKRIHDDVVQPLIDAGRGRVWLVGTSLGAFGSLAYAKAYPQDVAAVVLLGAYLGEAPILEAIERSGGLAQWVAAGSPGYDYELRTWSWLRQFATTPQSRTFELYVGYGRDDSYAPASRILASVLPPDHVFVAAQGGHDWTTWLTLWKRILRQQSF